MTKDEYLNHKDVSWVRNSLAKMLDSRSLEHSYYHFDTRRHWRCTSARDAAKNYFFPIEDQQVRALWSTLHPGTPPNGTLFHTTAVLNELEDRLRRALDGPGERAALRACDLILRWGGVRNGNHKKLDKLHRSDLRLVGYLRCAKELLSADEDYSTREAWVIPGQALYCNAGFTKIYSLLIDDFVIYDSRVAAALGMLIVQLCRSTSRREVPKLLRFLRMSARSKLDPVLKKYVPTQLRNPDLQAFTFSTQRSDGDYLTHNIRAGWLLRDAVKRIGADWSRSLIPARCSPNAAGCTQPHPPHLSELRAVEAALFMIGYDLSGNRDYPANRFAPRKSASSASV